jgi:hypothetical protein
MKSLEINKAYVGDTQAAKIYLGTDVVWQPASSGSLLELVWDDTPGWYEPDPQNPDFAIGKARFRPYFNGEPLSFDISQLDTPWFVDMSPVQSNKWIKVPTPAENLQDEWIELEWINGGSENDDVRTRSFEVAVKYSGYSASTTIVVETNTGYIDWGGAIGQFGPNQAIAMSVNAKYYDGGMNLVTIPIANSGNNYNFGTWTYSADTPGDFAYIGYDNWDGQNNTFTFGWNRTGGTGNTSITMFADWCGFQTSAALLVSEPVDPMFWEPLTIEIENPGTGETTGLLWRLSGTSRASDVSEYGRSIYYTLNDGPLTLVEITGTPSTSKTVDVVIATGLSQGDVFKFYGASSAVGGYGFVSGTTEAPFHYFVNYAGLQAKVYGNIKSLLTDSTTWGDYVVSYNKEAIDNIAMNDRAFMRMFQGKTAFTFNEDATYHLVLPDRNLSTRCFADMFNGCTRMAVAPKLPATALTEMCYYHLFSGCTGLVTPPELPATTLATGCYRSMFQNCRALTDAPVLPAPVLAASAYSNMFVYCRNITGVTCLAEDISAPECTRSWLQTVNASGTFTKSANMTGWTRDVSGIPTGWTVQDYVVPNP